jgi:hypothetical protein
MIKRRFHLLVMVVIARMQRHRPPGYRRICHILGSASMAHVAQCVAESPIFDATAYIKWNADVDFSRVAPEDHYRRFGIWENRDPGPLFSCCFYGEKNPDVAQLPAVPHYILFGDKEGRAPNELFDPEWVKPFLAGTVEETENSLLAYARQWCELDVWPNPLFDSQWYATEYEEHLSPGAIPLAHFLSGRNADTFNPDPLFDSSWYRLRYPWIGGLRPLYHYLHHGSQLEYDPSPAISGRLLSLEAAVIIGSREL